MFRKATSKANSLLLSGILSGLFFGIVLTGCNSQEEVPNDPKKVLTAYISKSFDVKSPTEKQELVNFLAKDAKARLSAWSDDQFREAFIETKREFVKLVFTESKTRTPNDTDITYELTYIDQGKAAGSKVTQKKLAHLIQDQGKWLISDVQSIKELVEYKNEMSLP